MKLLYTRNWYATVRRPGPEGPISVDVHFADSVREIDGVMTVAPSDLKVIEAHYEVFRSQNGRSELGRRDLPGLVGAEMYFGCGKAIATGISDDPDGGIADLMKEAVKVLIQSEPLFLEERGFSTLDDYQKDLLEAIAGTCYYLASPDCNPSTVRDKFQFHHRGQNFFSRHRSLYVYEDGDCYRVLGTISDGWHELDLDVLVRTDSYQVIAARGNFVRLPDQVCRGSAHTVASIVGQSFTPENARALVTSAGLGCEHLMDLTREAIKAIHCDWVQLRKGARFPTRGLGGPIDLQR